MAELGSDTVGTDAATGATLPARQFVAFARLDLEPGESTTVAFMVPMSLLTCTWFASDLVIEPGPVQIGAGGGSRDIRSSATFTVTGQTRAISGGGPRVPLRDYRPR